MQKTGTLHCHADFPSRFVAPRHVEVWLPPGYATSGARYPVLYMHDGQNLFDPATATNGVTWGVAEALTALCQSGQARPALIVGIAHSGPDRWRDYLPQKPLEIEAVRAAAAAFADRFSGPVHSDAYLHFLTAELKPFVDSLYRTLPDRPDTFVMGSSMGGLISLYALTEYPHLFGGAGCVSTHWPAGGEALVDALAARLPRPGAHRLYFDYGTAALDADYEPYQLRMDAHLRAAGYTLGRDWLTRKFEGADHSEAAWRQRVHIPLSFLLPTN